MEQKKGLSVIMSTYYTRPNGQYLLIPIKVPSLESIESVFIWMHLFYTCHMKCVFVYESAENTKLCRPHCTVHIPSNVSLLMLTTLEVHMPKLQYNAIAKSIRQKIPEGIKQVIVSIYFPKASSLLQTKLK